ncbi:MAG: aldo/keto reductase, partial [Treponema sp.]|nr:aldo/keto reductase [Treponema sp.]
LNAIAVKRGQSLADMALAWNLREDKVTSVLIGASRPEQILDGVRVLENMHFEQDELDEIDKILA